MGKILIIKDADFSASKIEKVDINTDPNKLVLSNFTRKFFNKNDFTTDVPMAQANRIRYYIQVDGASSLSVNYDVSVDSSNFDKIGINVQPTEEDCYLAATNTAIQQIANPLEGSVSAEITSKGWLCISVGGGFAGPYMQELVDYIENHLTVKVTI